ncbi:MAG TPA: phosphoglucosamine mutase [Gaiellaceae bacterium]|nr:phosphoglucosamine mutase [Gaiellaceae bacterium]
MRRYFGTDGVRGVVGDDLTPQLVERIGRAGTLWAGPGRTLVGRDTRSSGPELEQAVARGIASAGGTALLGGVLPTPAVALLAEELGVVVSASHNPPEYNGVKFFRRGAKLADEDEEEIEALLDSPGPGGGTIEELADQGEAYLRHIVGSFGASLAGLRVGVDCANGAMTPFAPQAFERLGAEVHPLGVEPDGANINVGCGATDLTSLQRLVRSRSLDLGVAFDGDGDRMLAVDERGEQVDGDQILAVLALHLGVDVVAVTVMTNLGFHRLMAEHRVKVLTTPVGDRYVLEALRREGALLGGEQSGHLIWLGSHVTGDGLAAALVLCGALEGRTLSEAVAVMPRFPQVIRNIAVPSPSVPRSVLDAVDRTNAELGDRGRLLVRPSGTEPVVRVLAEAENAEDAEKLCASIAALVQRELG